MSPQGARFCKDMWPSIFQKRQPSESDQNNRTMAGHHRGPTSGGDVIQGEALPGIVREVSPMTVRPRGPKKVNLPLGTAQLR